VSAQKGLVAKVTDDADLLEKPVACRCWKTRLGRGMMGKRQKILADAMVSGISELRSETNRVINIRKRDLTEQMMELKGCRARTARSSSTCARAFPAGAGEFDLGGAKIHAVRSVHLKLLREVFGILGSGTLKAEMAS
jgi:hypothetical protein